MFGLKIFVRVQTFRRGPPVHPRNFCHSFSHWPLTWPFWHLFPAPLCTSRSREWVDEYLWKFGTKVWNTLISWTNQKLALWPRSQLIKPLASQSTRGLLFHDQPNLVHSLIKWSKQVDWKSPWFVSFFWICRLLARLQGQGPLFSQRPLYQPAKPNIIRGQKDE